MDWKKGNIGTQASQINGHPTKCVPALEFFKQIPERLQNCVKSHLKHLERNELKLDTTRALKWMEKESFDGLEVNLDKQLHAWKENSNWVDQPPKITMDWKKGNIGTQTSQINGHPTKFVRGLEFFKQIPHRLQNCVKSHLKHLERNELKLDTTRALKWMEKEPFGGLEVNLDEQLHAWKENSDWVDQPPKITVSVPKGSLCNLNVKFNVGLPPDAIYNIVTDPENKRVFKNIKEVISRRVLVDEGHRQVVEVEQAAIWRFLWWSGTISVHVFVDQNLKDHTVKFKQGRSGFMKRFEGCWRVEPLFVDEQCCYPHKPTTLAEYYSCTGGKGRVGSIVSLDQLIQPAFVPPPPLSWYLRGITTKTTEMLINDLLEEAARLRGVVAERDSLKQDYLPATSDVLRADCLAYSFDYNIKERWLRRRSLRRQRSHRSRRSYQLRKNHLGGKAACCSTEL